MSYHRIFLERQTISEIEGGVFEARLDADDMRHAKAARIRPGEVVSVIDASSDFFACEVLEITQDGFVCKISSKEPHAEPPFVIHLFQGLPKAGKLEEVVRHATEVGVDGFFPLVCERSIVKLDSRKSAKKVDRLKSIAKSAAVQSGRLKVPEVSFPVTLQEAAGMLEEYDSAVVFWEEADASLTLADALSLAKSMAKAGEKPKVAVFVGPEGGFSEAEALLLTRHPNSSLSTLGPTILRTETAGVVGCALVSYELGGMGSQPPA